eukprot:4328392-Pleurochrysis_carterae.AAC.1
MHASARWCMRMYARAAARMSASTPGTQAHTTHAYTHVSSKHAYPHTCTHPHAGACACTHEHPHAYRAPARSHISTHTGTHYTPIQSRMQFIATQLVAAALRINLEVPLVRYDDARAQPELAEVLQRWAREGYGTSSRRVMELGAQPTLILGLAEPDVASLIQKAYRDRRLIDAACRLQKFFRGRRADDAAHCLQKFFRRKIAIPRTTERRMHRRMHARVVPDHKLKIAASDAWRLTLEEQLQDLPLRVVHESITASSAAKLA